MRLKKALCWYLPIAVALAVPSQLMLWDFALADLQFYTSDELHVKKRINLKYTKGFD